MLHTYQDPKTAGILNLICQEPGFERYFFREPQSRLLTIAWNVGDDQAVLIDGINYLFPRQTMLPLMVSQSVSFEHPDTIVAWQFDRAFYCIVDHDKEVSCVGFLFYGAKDPLFLALSSSEQTKFDALLTVFHDEFSTHDAIQGEMLRMLLKRLIIKLTRLAKEQYLDPTLSEKDLDLVRRFNLLVEIHYRKLHAVSDYAELLNKSPKTLSNLFAIYNQKSPLQLIHERIVLEAKRLLLYTDKSTKEIAYELGFEEVPHFSRFFKKQVNLPPSEFKEHIKSNLSIPLPLGKN
ncbi:helix-turn-helix domain-containing protein [Spirosoma radiotolerans]|uniref:AraC family transcriptional regulator n=1 Tax=Spirosoma radiotolerans TaxID=1379870 RepID=A0A0E3ZTK7_9BACT|nr:helix-turn-helix domain-containing protein [Spirosoma radiotolerans]AKD53963.1 AraC family transcriptional regulator [Spirosoma radiotolerans]